MTYPADKTPVIMLHSCANSSRQWAKLAAELGGNFLAICPELLGYGKGAATGPSRTMEDMVEHIMQTIAIFDEPVHVIGHSFGGAVALKLASLHPQSVKTLTVVEPAAFSLIWSAEGPDAPALSELMEMKRASETATDNDASMRHFVDFWSEQGSWDAIPDDQRAYLATKAPLVHADFATLSNDRFTKADLQKITCPVLNISGNLSPSAVSAVNSVLSATLHQMTQVVIHGVGHMAPITHPERVNPAIAAFLAQAEVKCQDSASFMRVAA